VYPSAYRDGIEDGERRSCGAPNLVRWPDGRLLCTFSTDEDSGVPTSLYGLGWNWYQWGDIKFVLSRDSGVSWSGPEVAISERGTGELVNNPTFETSLSPWLGTGWSWQATSGTIAKHDSTAVPLWQPLPLETGKHYIVAVTMAGGNPTTGRIGIALYKMSGALRILEYYGDAARTAHLYYTQGDTVHSELGLGIPSYVTDRGIYIVPDSQFTGWIDNVSVVCVESRVGFWSYLSRLHDESLLCTTCDGPWGPGYYVYEVRIKRGGHHPEQ